MTRPSSLGPLSVYLLGTIEFDEALACNTPWPIKYREIAAPARLILCEHPPLITVGRHGRPAQSGL